MACASVITESLFASLRLVVDGVLEFLRRLGADGVGNLLNLERNADTLAREMTELKRIRDDLENKVRNQERRPGMRRTHQVSGWLENVDALHAEVRSVEDALARRPSFLESCSFDSLHSGYVIGGSVASLLRRVGELKGQRGNLGDPLVDEALPDTVVAGPSRSARIVGALKTLTEVHSHLRNEEVGIIGIYGMGGVGKTTLLREIKSQFEAAENHGFDVVIWVTVSKDQDIFKVQEDIGVRLGFTRLGDPAGYPLPENKDDRREALYRALSKKRFLLLLDDMWMALDLDEVGIPRPDILSGDGKKIVFTTRSEEVCADMDAQQSKVKVGFLGGEESWALFRSKMDARVVDGIDNDPDIRPLARTVVQKCGGLPLALITVGRGMSNATRVGEWRRAVESLRDSPNEIRGMRDVLSVLRFSFDRLDNDITRECLLYCAIFPDDYDIPVPLLVDYWVGEGFLDADPYGFLCEARDRGDCIIRKLKNACLLEESDRDLGEELYVKMHDVVREMALWLTGEEFDRNRRFFVCDEEKRLGLLGEASTWVNAKRISVMLQRDDGFELPSLEESKCPNLLTVLTSNEHRLELVVPRSNFFQSTPVLRVVDLSGTGLRELPDAIGSLAELRHLNLSSTNITQLPKELGKLVKLRQLNLRDIFVLQQIPQEALLTLTRLQTLDLCNSGYGWERGDGSDGVRLIDLESDLVRLEELSVDVNSLSCLETLANSRNLQRCTREVLLQEAVDYTSDHLSAALEKLVALRRLHIKFCPAMEVWTVDCSRNQQLGSLRELTLFCLDQLRDFGGRMEAFRFQRGGRQGQGSYNPFGPLFPSLRYLDIFSCGQLKDLRWIGQLPHLGWLYVTHCDGLEELLLVDDGGGEEEGNDHGASLFPKLRKMSLFHLPALRSISERPLLFPSLEELVVVGCPQLKRLPLGRYSCKKIKEIRAQQGWWDALQWDDDDDSCDGRNIKWALAPFFHSLPDE